jgi:hypothetical protein
MSGKKTTAQEMIDGITGGTAKIFKETETEIYKQRLKLEELLKKNPVEGLFAGIERDVKAAGEAAKTITDPKKFKLNVFDKLWISFQTEFPKFLKNKASDFAVITKPIRAAFDKEIVKPTITGSKRMF